MEGFFVLKLDELPTYKHNAYDGRQAMTGSIGLPEFFMDESKWQLILLVYFGGMIFGLPVVVWRWCGCAYSRCDLS